MDTPYRDKGGQASAYRAVLMFRTVAVLMLAVILIAAVFPQIGTIQFSLICLVLMLPGLPYQIWLDSTLIHTGQALVEDGGELYVVIGSSKLGFGRRHHMKKKVSTYHISRIQRTKMIREYPFGIAVRAVVQTASSKEEDVEPEALLRREGQEKTRLFRLERSLRLQDEARLLQRLRELEH